MAVLGHDALGDVALLRILFIVIVTIQEHDDIGILLNGAGLTQVRQHGALVLTLFVGTGQLGQAQHRHLQLLGHDLQHTADIRHRLLAVLAAIPLSAGGGHQLEVVNDHQTQILDAAALGVHVRHRQQGIIVDADIQTAQGGGALSDLHPVALPQVAADEAGIFDEAFAG